MRDLSKGFRSKVYSSSTAYEQPSPAGNSMASEPLVPPLNTSGGAVPDSDSTTHIQSLTICDERAALPPHQDRNQAQSHATTTDTDLWTIALESRPDDERAAIITTTASDPDLDILERLSDELKQKRDQCGQERLKYKFHGQQIVMQDILEKALVWINKFKEIGDIVVQYDPVHAALPWAGVRFILQTVTAGSEQRAALLVGVEKISSMISRCRVHESMYLEKQSSDQSIKNLHKALVAAYARIQGFLLIAHRLHNKGSAGRALHAMLNPAEIIKFLDDFIPLERRIEDEARICESVYAREAAGETAKKIDDLKMLLLSYKQPSSRLDSRVATMFTQLGKARQSEMLQWISPIPYQDSHESARERRTKGTGHWLLENSRFSAWQNSSSSTTLWLHGSPGTGKTKLVSHVVDNLRRRLSSSPNDEALAYFYCDRNRTDYQTPTSILSSFVRQLSISRDGQLVQQSTVLLYDKKKSTGFASSQLSLEECQDQLRELTAIYPQTTLILDALDECDKSTRIGLMNFLNELVKRSSRLLKIFIASRPDLDLRIKFEPGLNVEIKVDDNEKDIKKYVEDTITNTNSPPYWQTRISKELRESVCETLVSRSEGMFQWVALQIQQLHKLSRERDIKLRLGKMPNTLDKAYHEIYDRIQSADGSAPEVAKRAFQWIMCSEKLMSPAMLVAAVCQDPNTDDIDIVDIDFDFVLESCQNLLKVEIAEKEAVCRFSHLSVQEYLEKNHSSPLSNDVLVAQVCLTFLTSSTYPTPSTLSLERAEEESEETNKSREVEENGMKEIIAYASTHWLIHVQRSGEVEGDFDNRLITLLKRFLGTGAETTPAYKVWHRARVTAESRYSFEIRSVHSRYSLSIDWLRPISTLAIQIAMFGLHRMLHDSWEYVEPGQENTRGQPLLVIAAYGGCASMVLSLLDKGAKIDASSTESPSALYEASERGQNSVVKVLVENDANVNISGGFYSNALQVASMKGHTSIVEMLLAGGANVNAQGGKYGNALQAALMRGHTSIVKLLLVNGAHVNVQRGMYHNALQVASMGGHAVIVEFLLVNGTNVNAQKGKYHNAFQAVSMMGHALLMKLLFTDEANVNAQGEPHHNALQAASNRGFEGVVRILLKYGAFDRDNGALMVAASRGHESIVAILLQTSTSSLNDILIAACKGKTAYGKSHDNIQGVVNKLLDAGAVDPQGKALIKAAGQGYTSAVARLLKEHNAGLDEALVSACRLHTFEYSKKTQEDAEAIVMLLLNAGAMDRKGHALQEATKSGFAEVAALLREAAEKTNDRISENAENLSDERISLKGAIDGSET